MNLVACETDWKLSEPAVYLLQKYNKNSDAEAFESVVEFSEDLTLSKDAYRIEIDGGRIRVFGNTAVAFNAAVGYLIRHQHTEMKPCTVTFDSDFRATYFANHFYNYYHAAPIAEVCDYIESLALWGQNTVCLWFDMHHFNGFDSPEAEAMLDRMLCLFKKAKGLGMKCWLTRLANEYFFGADKELLAENSTADGRYFYNPMGYYFTELCPSKPRGEALVLASLDELLKRFEDVGLDGMTLWPYDQGGCTCKACYPWGSNGFYKLSKASARVAKKYFPDIEIVLSCWRFDSFTRGEWSSFLPLIKTDGDWIDRLMVDIGGKIPDSLKDISKPIVSFPEISMHRATPWGGFGANPMPLELKKQVQWCNSFCKGGALYSEGVFEDINKAVSLELMRDPENDPKNTVKEYCDYHFGTEYSAELTDIIMCLEETLSRQTRLADGSINDYPSGKPTELHTFVLRNPDNVLKIAEDMKKLDDELPQSIKDDWRYKILYIRAVADAELLKNSGVPNEETDKLYSQLTEIYHSEKAYYFVAPITRKSIMENRGEGV